MERIWQMLSDGEILERNNRLREAVLRNRELRIGNYNILIEYFLYYPERKPCELPIHTHRFWELSFLTDGKVDYWIRREEHTVSLKENDNGYVFIPPYQKHFRRNSCENVLILGFMLTVSGAAPEDDRRFLEAVRKRKYSLLGSRGREAAEVQELLSRPPDVLDAEELNLKLRLLLVAIFRENFPDLFRTLPGGMPKHNPVWLAETLISEQLRTPFRVEELARRCGLSRRHFYRCFEAEYGMPVNEFIRRKRLLQAAHDLLHTEHPLKEIADDAGFRNMSYFIRQFRRVYSVTPGQYRTKRNK